MIRILSVAIALILLVTGSGFAADITPNLDKGTKAFHIGGRLDTDTPADFQYDLQLGLGYFFWNNLELGVAVDVGGNDFYDRYDLGVYGQYNISTGSQWVPFLFLGAYYAGMEMDDDIFNVAEKTDFDTAVGKAGAGLSWFLRDNISLDIKGVYSFANDTLWVNQDGEPQDSNVTGMIGLRFYFD
jgi:opacity protein-like surface antigen